MLRPLEGAGFKEAGAYSLKNNRGVALELGRAKVHRFPFLEAFEQDCGDPFLSADGSVSYMFEAASTPYKIRLDNPLACAVFVLRDPVQRTWWGADTFAHTTCSFDLVICPIFIFFFVCVLIFVV